MGKKILLLLVLFSVALVGTTYAAVENIKVSGDINSEAVVRDLNLGFTTIANENDDQFAFSQIRLRFDADLTEGVSAVVGLINERVWGQESVANTDLDLDLAYVELKEFLYEQVSLTIGRQNLRYGNGLIIADPDTNRVDVINSASIGDLSLRKSFDAVKVVFDYAPFVIDLVYSKIEENTLNMNDDVTLFGVNVSYLWDSYNGITEAYFFGSDKAPGNGTDINTIDSKSNVYVIGARNQLDLNDNLGLGLELAYQFGEYKAGPTNHPDLDAYAIQANAEYKFLNDYDAKFGLQYTYLSGDDPRSDDYNAWNPLFEDQTPGEILNILFGNTNMQYLKASVSAVPREDVTVGVNYTYARLAEKIATLPLSVGPATGNTYAINADKRDIGQEIDLVGVFDYTEDVQIKLAGGLFLPGHLFDKANDNSGYSVRAGINVDF